MRRKDSELKLVISFLYVLFIKERTETFLMGEMRERVALSEQKVHKWTKLLINLGYIEKMKSKVKGGTGDMLRGRYIITNKLKRFFFDEEFLQMRALTIQ